MERNIIWFSHGSQDHKKEWFLFPFKSLTFYAPNDTFVMNQPSLGLHYVCRNECHKWTKLPVVDVLNNKYKVKYSCKKLKMVMDLLDEQDNDLLDEYLNELGVGSPDDLNYVFEFKNILNMTDENTQTHIKEILGLGKQVPLIKLRDMQFQVENDVFQKDYGIWECQGNGFRVGDLFLINNFMNEKGIQSPNSLTLADALQLIEDTLIEQNINPADCNIKMVACRISNNNRANAEDIKKEVLTNGLRVGVKNGKKWAALNIKRYSPGFKPLTFIKKATALNNEILAIPENKLASYLNTDLPDLEDGETKSSCPSYHKQPVECNETPYKKQLLYFHPDKNRSCQKASTRKFQRLNEMCRPSFSKSLTPKSHTPKSLTRKLEHYSNDSLHKTMRRWKMSRN